MFHPQSQCKKPLAMLVFGNLCFAKKCWRILQVFEWRHFTQISFDSWWCVWCPLYPVDARERNETSKNLSFLLLEWKIAVAPIFARCLQCHLWKKGQKILCRCRIFPPLQVVKGYKSLPIVYSIHVTMVDYLHLLDLHGSYGLGRWLKSHHLVTVSKKWRCRTRMTRWKTRSIWMPQLLVWTLRR